MQEELGFEFKCCKLIGFMTPGLEKHKDETILIYHVVLQFLFQDMESISSEAELSRVTCFDQQDDN